MTARILLLIICSVLSASDAFPKSASQYLSLPEGDPVEGRRAFKELKCNSCHRISSDIEMAGPVAASGAPDLGVQQSRYKPAYLADSIIYPHHAVLMPDGRFDHFAKSTPMGDFSDSITVRQLADIVAYLSQLDEEV